MVSQMLIERSRTVGAILNGTPTWVWALLGALVLLGWSQTKPRTAGLVRVALLPIAMTALSVWGTFSAAGNSPQRGDVLLAWIASAAFAAALTAPGAPPRGTRFDSLSRTFTMPGSWVPMLLILGVFVTRYVVGVKLAMQPTLASDEQFASAVSAIYGFFSGIFVGRTARLWRFAMHPANAAMHRERLNSSRLKRRMP
jgi:hypothetical protein